MKLLDIKEVRGMGDPLHFSFNVLKPNRLVAHAICFISYEVSNGSTEMTIGNFEKDPRFNHLLHFICTNYLSDKLKEEIKHAQKELAKVESEIERLRKQLDELPKSK